MTTRPAADRGQAGVLMKKFDWQALLVDGYEPLRRAQRVFRRLPHDPRCRLCLTPFGGVGGKLVRAIE